MSPCPGFPKHQGLLVDKKPLSSHMPCEILPSSLYFMAVEEDADQVLVSSRCNNLDLTNELFIQHIIVFSNFFLL